MRIEIPARLIEKTIRFFLPVVTSTMHKFSANAGSDGLPPNLKAEIERFDARPWANVYEGIENLQGSLAVAASQNHLLQEVFTLPKLPPVVEPIPSIEVLLQPIFEHFFNIWERALDDDSDDDIAFMEEPEPQPWEFASDDEPISKQAMFLKVAMVIAFNHFACMVHRQSMFQLVAQAKEGCDESLFKAIQIDKTCMDDIPYFAERIQTAKDELDTVFQAFLKEARDNPITKTRVTNYPLYFIFSMLDSIAMLDAVENEKEWFANLCWSLGAYGRRQEAVEVDSFLKILRRFKKQYRTLSPIPIFGHNVTLAVKDTKSANSCP